MATRKQPPKPSPDLDPLRRIQVAMEELPDQFQNAFSPGRQLLLSYLKGIASGLGAITALAIVIPILLWFLQSIQWVPLIGNFVMQVTEQVQQARK